MRMILGRFDLLNEALVDIVLEMMDDLLPDTIPLSHGLSEYLNTVLLNLSEEEERRFMKFAYQYLLNRGVTMFVQ